MNIASTSFHYSIQAFLSPALQQKYQVNMVHCGVSVSELLVHHWCYTRQDGSYIYTACLQCIYHLQTCVQQYYTETKYHSFVAFGIVTRNNTDGNKLVF